MVLETKVEPKNKKFAELRLNGGTIEVKSAISYRDWCDTCGRFEIEELKKGICRNCWRIIDRYAYREMVFTEHLNPVTGH